MAEIQVLSPQMANMIAAGEVVERPCSVVKELVENSVDAGASQITVEVAENQYIRITDNGCGIPQEQLQRAFLRHATSKLQTPEQLGKIGTLGFRGEALAAISAVSKVKIISSTAEQDFPYHLKLEGGTVVEEGESSGPVGTSIEVCELFYNTPARQKFLKSPRSENSAILSLIQELALSHPEISFKFIREGKEELHSVGDGSMESVLSVVLGKNIAAGLRQLSLSDLSSTVEGFVSLPSCCRASRSYQHFFVNGRYVKSPMLVTAVENAYKNQKMVGRFPACVLYLTLHLTEVDVNVHPAKTTVKFAHEKDIFQLVYQGVKQGLTQYTDIQKVELAPTNTERNITPLLEEQQTPEPNPNPEPEQQSFLEEKRIAPSSHSLPNGNIPQITTNFQNISLEEEEVDPELVEEVEEDVQEEVQDDVLVEDAKELCAISTDKEELSIAEPAQVFPWEKEETALIQKPEQGITSAEEYEDTPLEESFTEPEWRVVGEFFKTYIAVEVGEEIYLIDKHAVHERMNFERLKSQEYLPMAQTLMKPVVLNLSPEEMAILMENLPLFEEFSFQIEEFSPRSVIIREAPYDILEEDIPETIHKLLGKLHLGDSPDPTGARDHMLHSIACQSAIKAGYDTKEQEHKILAQMVMEQRVKHCPHGRPVVASLSKKELEKRFKRIL